MFMNRNKYQDIFKRILIIFLNFFFTFHSAQVCVRVTGLSHFFEYLTVWHRLLCYFFTFLLWTRCHVITRTMTQVPSSATGMSCPCWRYKCTYLFMFPWFLHKRVRVIIVFIYISPAGWYTWPGCQADVTSQAKSDALLKRKS